MQEQRPQQQSQPQQPVPRQPQPQYQQPQFQPQPSQPYPGQPQPQQAHHSSIQVLLLSLGVGLVAIAVLIFTSLAYALMGDTGRALCIAIIALATLAAGWALTIRLRVTAEGLTWAALIALTIDAYGTGDHHVLSAIIDSHILIGLSLAFIALTALGFRALPLPGGAQPLRAYSLFAVFALPLAAHALSAALPIGEASSFSLARLVITGLTASLMTMLLPIDARSRNADFEWLGVSVFACVIFAVATIRLSSTTAVLHTSTSLWVIGVIVTGIIAGWVMLLVAYRTRRRTPSDCPLSAGWRITPMIGLIVTIAVASTPIQQALAIPLPYAIARACAETLTIVMLGTILIAAICASGGMWSAQERNTGALTSAIILTILAIGEFESHYGPVRVVSLIAYATLLIAVILPWIRDATSKPRNPLAITRWMVTWPAVVAGLALFVLALHSHVARTPADLITGVSGVAVLAVGARWMAVRPMLRSRNALSPGLALLMVPSLIAGWTAPPSPPRMIALFVIAVIAVMVGAILGLQAPLAFGAVVLTAHVLTVLWPWLGRLSEYWWAWVLLAAGVMLIIMAARYEASLKSMRNLAVRFSQLR
ncbi:SCO7613 C-terminal domain-containing membrane protein [Bifidobacterium oedipodis]|nr:hypothetical protein [Bifidobacterium sp. DSM 109957]